MIAVYKRELKSAFCNMTGAIFIAFVLLLTGIYTTIYNFTYGIPFFEYSLSGVTFILLLAVPILTMRSIAEEKSAKTDSLLYSLPIGMTSVVIGKYLALVTIHTISTLVMATYPLILSLYGDVNLISAYGTLVIFYLLVCALIAVGMFVSSLTESQVIAAVISFASFLLLYLLSPLSSLIPTTSSASLVCFILLAVIIGLVVQAVIKNSTVSICVSAVLSIAALCVYLFKSELFEGLFPKLLTSLALFDRMSAFVSSSTGSEIFDVTAVFYYLSVIALFVYFTVQSMEKKRWN